MRTIRIRTFTMLGLYLIFMIPWLFYMAANYMENGTLSLAADKPDDRLQQSRKAEIVQMIESDSAHWTDPTWQERLYGRLRQAKMDIAIVSASDQDIYRSDPGRNGVSKSTERFSVLEDGRLVGKVVLYAPNSKAVQAVAAVVGLVLAFVLVGFEMRRRLLKPLERMSAAARLIAAGDWDAQLPLSGIREIAEVRNGFNVMVKGLQESYRIQAESEEERRFVIGAVAHDLRTPLFALRGYLDGMEQGIARSPEKLAYYLAVCKEKSAQLDRLVEDLFTFTKIEYLQAELDKRKIDLRLILQKAVDSLNPIARQKHIAVIANDTADDCISDGDSHLLERAMTNLLDNAVRHTPQHGQISIRCRKEGRRVTFAILDSGPGFSPEELRRAFETLYRGEKSRNRSTGGAGLGLTFSQRIIRRHGGELAAGNDPDGGALLSGWIPAADH